MSSDVRTEAEAERREEKLLSAERLVFFSDAVVAIALTLLALELPVPEGNTNREVLDFFRANKDEYIAFLISFAVIGIHWFGHHRSFARVVGLGGRLASWNMLWLLTIVITPFATKVLTGEGAFQARFTLYASVQALSGIFLLLMARTMDRRHLRPADASPQPVAASYVRLGTMIVAFLISIPIAFVTEWAYVCWALYPIVARTVNALLTRRSRVIRPMSEE